MTESAYNETVSKIPTLTNAELDEGLEDAAAMTERGEMLSCCYLSAVRERRAFIEFGYANIYDYAHARFAFGERKTRYLVSLGQKLECLPKIRAAMASGKLGWCKASRAASAATPDNEAMWLDSALSLSLRELEKRIKDGTDSLASVLHLPLNEERRVMWENALEIYRRRAGAEISPVEAFELMTAEVIAEWGHVNHFDNDTETQEEAAHEDEAEAEVETSADEDNTPPDDAPAPAEQPVFPWAEEIDTTQLWESERAAEKDFATTASYNEVRNLVLERDGWKCTYPGCGARAQLHVHHILFRSRGGGDAPWNLTTVCNFHHELIHSARVGVQGRAPVALEWTPPKLMQAVLDRRRNNPSIWVGDLEVREWSLEPRATTS